MFAVIRPSYTINYFWCFRCYKALDETISGLVIIHCHAIHIHATAKSQDECHDLEIPKNPFKAGTCKLFACQCDFQLTIIANCLGIMGG